MRTALTFAAEFAVCYVALHVLAWGVDLAIRRQMALDTAKWENGAYGRRFIC